MLSQWSCFLKNLGEWHGSFTRLSARGEVIEDSPSIVTFEGQQNDRAVHQVVHLPQDTPPKNLELDYTETSLSRSILFFEDGTFCQGSMQWSPYGKFGSEFGMRDGDRRLRMVQLYNDSQLEKFVLIREKLPNSNTPERPHLTVDSLIGQWQGSAVTMYADLKNPDTFETHLKITKTRDNHLEQTLSFGDRNINTSARIEDNRLLFENSPLPIQILLLPDGASCNCPIEPKLGHNFVLEMGWLIEPLRRQRIMRTYNDKGNWTSCTLVTETKIG